MNKLKFYHPKFIPTWFLIGFMIIGAKIPFKTQLILGKILGRIMYIFCKKFRKIAFINVSRCFEKNNIAKTNNFIKKHFESLGISVFEILNCFFMTDKKVKKLYQIENNQHLQKAIDNNKNIILLVGHFTSMIFIGRILAQNFYLAVVYKQQKNLLFNHIMRKQYSKHGAILVEAKNAKGIVKTMKNGMPVWYPHDQDLGKEVSVFAPFFNIQTATISATARLAKMTNSVVIPIDFYRDNDIYKIKIQPAIKDYPNDDMVKSATITNEILQKQILNAPEQYLWIHRRFKTRPNDEEYFY